MSGSFGHGGGTLGSQMKEKNSYITKWGGRKMLTKDSKISSFICKSKWSIITRSELGVKNETKHMTLVWKLESISLSLCRGLVELAPDKHGTGRWCRAFLRQSHTSDTQTQGWFISLHLAKPCETEDLSLGVTRGCVYMLATYTSERVNSLSDCMAPTFIYLVKYFWALHTRNTTNIC